LLKEQTKLRVVEDEEEEEQVEVVRTLQLHQ